MFILLKDIYQRRELLYNLIVRNLKIRYKNSVLGFFWTLLGPIFLIIIYSVFLGFLKLPVPLPVLVTGIIAWQFLAMCLGDSQYAIIGNANLVTKTSFPRIILPLAMVKANMINFLLSFIVLLIYLGIVRVSFGAVYWLPVIMITHFALCLGVSLIVSCSNVYFRDTEHIMSIFMLAWFFVSPVIYPVEFILDKLPEKLHLLAFCNPMIGILTSYRILLLSSPNPGLNYLVISFLSAWLILLIGIAVFQKYQAGFGDEL